MALNWESAGTDETGDQNADSAHGTHAFWSLGPDRDAWRVALIVRDDNLDEIPAAGVDLGVFRNEAMAKLAVEVAESFGPYAAELALVEQYESARGES